MLIIQNILCINVWQLYMCVSILFVLISIIIDNDHIIIIIIKHPDCQIVNLVFFVLVSFSIYAYKTIKKNRSIVWSIKCDCHLIYYFVIYVQFFFVVIWLIKFKISTVFFHKICPSRLKKTKIQINSSTCSFEIIQWPQPNTFIW